MAAKLYYAFKADESTGTTSILGYYNSKDKLKKVLAEDKTFAQNPQETEIYYFDVPKEITEYINTLQNKIAILRAAAQDTPEYYLKNKKGKEV